MHESMHESMQELKKGLIVINLEPLLREAGNREGMTVLSLMNHISSEECQSTSDKGNS
jgi:hypothetical protein